MTRDQLIADLRQAEGVRDCAYDDATGHAIRSGSIVKGFPTIGVGCRVDLPISDAVIDLLLDERLTAVERAAHFALPWLLDRTDSQQRAIIELAFSMGMQGLLGFPKLLTHLKHGDGSAAACELDGTKWCRDVGSTRSQRLMAQLRA